MKTLIFNLLLLCSFAATAQITNSAAKTTSPDLIIGGIPPAFTALDTDGEKISLSDFKGKYILLDFWASWCIPCRKEFPFLKKAYAKFKDKNFEIIGFSLDTEESLWISSIENDDVSWKQASNLKGYKDPVAVAYEINAVPTNWLIGPDGKIIARNLRGEQVEKVLAQLIK